MAVANGRIPTSNLTAIPARYYSHGSGAFLRADAAAAFLRVAAAFERQFGKPLVCISFYRTYNRQVEIFRERYIVRKGASSKVLRSDRKWNGVVYKLKPGYAPSAIPGISNHGLGQAVDFNAGVQTSGSKEHAWFQANAPAYGWDWTEGKRNGEPWHWTYEPAKDKHKNDRPTASMASTPSKSVKSAAQIEEEELMAAKDDIIKELSAKIDALPRQVWGLGGGSNAPMIPKGEGEGSEYPATALSEIVRRTVRSVPRAVWRGEMVGRRMEGGSEYAETTLGSMTDRIVRQQIVPLRGEVAGLKAALEQLAAGQGIDMDAITAAAEKGAREGATAVSAEDVAERLTVQPKAN